MYKLLKFYKAGFDAERHWDNKYAQEHIAGYSTEEFPKQGFWPLLQQNLERGKKYLDVGCGIGGWLIFLREQGYDVEGIDTSSSVARSITEYDRDAVVKVAGMTAIPYLDASLDGVLAIGALEYIEDKLPQALSEVRRVLKDGGVFFLEVPIANPLRRLAYIPLKQLEKAVRAAQGRQASFSNYLFTRADIQKLLHDAGFEVVHTQPHELPEADSHYGLYIDCPYFRGENPYKLNLLGRAVKAALNAISPWIASTGAVVVARKIKD